MSAALRCIHCGEEIATPHGTHWHHVHRAPDGNVYGGKNRCQSDDVPYGHEAHPALPCPDWCSGSREQDCQHLDWWAMPVGHESGDSR